jgi:iron complex transport system substrate-binding protein
VKDFYPERIVCLTEETTETLYLLGEEARIIGISGFTVRPKRARKEKPKVSAFTDANIEQIVDLKPDLVIGFSDIQAEIAKKLIERGLTIWVNNHRSIEDTFKMIIQLGALVGKKEEAMDLLHSYQLRIEQIKKEVKNWKRKPTVYFEEWYDPLISGIQWVHELIGIAGGVDVMAEKAMESLAKNRIIEDASSIVAKNPDIILASWCGKKFKLDRMLARPGWKEINAVKKEEIYEIDSSIILQPGPAALSEGLDTLHHIFYEWVQKNQA